MVICKKFKASLGYMEPYLRGEGGREEMKRERKWQIMLASYGGFCNPSLRRLTKEIENPGPPSAAQ